MKQYLLGMDGGGTKTETVIAPTVLVLFKKCTSASNNENM